MAGPPATRSSAMRSPPFSPLASSPAWLRAPGRTTGTRRTSSSARQRIRCGIIWSIPNGRRFAIFFVPHDVQGGFLLTASGGEGVLLRRHGDQWSDPIFLHIGGVGLGFEAGGEDESLAMVIMTDAGVDQLIDGVVRLGGSGGFALANLGGEGAGAGSIGSGIEVLSVATAEGLFAGGGIQGTKLWPGESYNAAVYGAGSNLAAIANGRGGQVSSAGELRAELAKAVIEAWGK